MSLSSPPSTPPLSVPEDLAPVPTRTIVLLAAASFASAASMRISDPMLPLLAREFGIGISAVTGVVSLFAIAYGIMQFAYGPLGDRVGKLRVIAAATLACVLGHVLAGLAWSFPALLAGRILSGATAAAIIPLAMAWIGDQVHYAQRQAVLARFLTGQIFGVICGQFAGGWFADNLGWRAAFFSLAMVYLVVGVVLWRRARREVRPAAPVAGAVRQGPLGNIGGVVARPWARVILAAVLIEGMIFFGAYAFVPLYLHSHFGISLTHAGLIAGAMGLGGLVFSWSVRHLLARLGESGLARGGGVCIAAGYLGLVFAPSAGWAAPACAIAGLGFYMLHNTLQINATQMAPEHRGTAVGLFASFLFLGQAVGVALAGFWATSIGERSLFIVAGLSVLVIGLLMGAALRRKVARAA